MSKVDTALALYEIYKALGGEGEIEGSAVNTPSLLLAISELVGGGGGGGEGTLYLTVSSGVLSASYNEIKAALEANKTVFVNLSSVEGEYWNFVLKELYLDTNVYRAKFDGSNNYESLDADTKMGESLGG